MTEPINLTPAGSQVDIHSMQLPCGCLVNGKFNVAGAFCTFSNIYFPTKDGKWIKTKSLRRSTHDLRFARTVIKQVAHFRAFAERMKRSTVKRIDR